MEPMLYEGYRLDMNLFLVPIPKTDRHDAAHILKLLVENRCPRLGGLATLARYGHAHFANTRKLRK